MYFALADFSQVCYKCSFTVHYITGARMRTSKDSLLDIFDVLKHRVMISRLMHINISCKCLLFDKYEQHTGIHNVAYPFTLQYLQVISFITGMCSCNRILHCICSRYQYIISGMMMQFYMSVYDTSAWMTTTECKCACVIWKGGVGVEQGRGIVSLFCGWLTSLATYKMCFRNGEGVCIWILLFSSATEAVWLLCSSYTHPNDVAVKFMTHHIHKSDTSWLSWFYLVLWCHHRMSGKL